MATTTMMTNTLSFDDIFYELNDDLDSEANEWQYLNNFYLNFDDEIQNDTDRHRFFYGIPDYLSASSSSFQTKFFSELRSLYNPIDFQNLQQLTILTHQLSIIHLHEQLWQRFLQVGKDQLKQQAVQQHTDLSTLSFWPEIVTSIMISKGIIHHDNRPDKINQNIYINFVQNYLNRLEQQAKQRRLQFDTITNSLPQPYAKGILNDKIEDFLRNEDSLSAMRLHFQRRIALLEYIRIDRSYQLAYFQQKPTHLQLQIAKQMFALVYDNEKAIQELTLFKFGALYKKLPKSLDLLEISLPTSITTISDPVLRERLSNEYQSIIQRAKADLMNVLTTAAEAKKNDSQKKFDKEIAEIWKNQRQYPIHEQFTPTMLIIIKEREKNIIECVKCIYELKGNFYVKAPVT